MWRAQGLRISADVATIDVYGNPIPVGCWRNPDYRQFWAAIAEDLFRNYDLDGFQWGAERMGPLMNVILPWNDRPPTCFCTHCVANGRAHGIDPQRARDGYEKLYTYVRGLATGGPKPPEGVATVYLRHLIRYPEILAWEYQYRLGREAVMKAMYDTTDFIKFIAYHDVLGPRIRYWYLERFHNTILSELTLQQSLDLYYAVFGYDPNMEPKLDELATKGFSPDYVYRETKRSVASANGKTRIYPGIGFDVPWRDQHLSADPEEVFKATIRAFEAGAAGIVVSREYEEMRVPNLRAVGRAVRQLMR